MWIDYADEILDAKQKKNFHSRVYVPCRLVSAILDAITARVFTRQGSVAVSNG